MAAIKKNTIQLPQILVKIRSRRATQECCVGCELETVVFVRKLGYRIGLHRGIGDFCLLARLFMSFLL